MENIVIWIVNAFTTYFAWRAPERGFRGKKMAEELNISQQLVGNSTFNSAKQGTTKVPRHFFGGSETLNYRKANLAPGSGSKF